MNQEEYIKHTEKMLAEKGIAAENLTTEQLARVIIQMIQCGDIIRYVQVGTDKQNVIYIPYAREQELLCRISELERGEFICKKCGLRKDSKNEPGDF